MVVAALARVHLLAVAVVVVLFFWRTKSSLLGNSWQAVAQVVTEKRMFALVRSVGSTDREVERDLVDEGLGRTVERMRRRR